MNIKYQLRCLALCVIALVASCGQQAPETKALKVVVKDVVKNSIQAQTDATVAQVEEIETVVATDLPVDLKSEVPPEIQSEEVLVSVNGSAVTASQLIRELERLFGKGNVAALNAATKKQVLETLMVRRLLGQEVWQGLDASVQQEIENDVNAYRERELLKRYLADQHGPTVVSDEMIRSWYQSHPEQYGAVSRRDYQLVLAGSDSNSADSEALIQALGVLAQSEDLQAELGALRANHDHVVYREGALNTALYPRPVSEQLESLNIGETRFFVHAGTPYLARLVGVEQTDPEPLSAVQGKIRRELSATQVRVALRDVMKTKLDQANIEYSDRVVRWGEHSAPAH